jgi:sugar phosphate isomerase/epimerase
MKVGLHTLLYPSKSVEESIKHLLMFNIECIEIVCDLPHRTPHEFDEKLISNIKDLLKSGNVETSIHAPIFDVNISSYYEDVARHSVMQVKKAISIAHDLDSKIVTVHLSPPPYRFFMEKVINKLHSRFLASIKECSEYAEECGVFLCLENTPEVEINRVWRETFMQHINEMLQITFDVGHAYISESLLTTQHNFPRQIEKLVILRMMDLKGFIRHIHVHDNDGISDLHLPPTYGRIDFTEIFKAIKEIGYEGQIIVEMADPRYIEPSDSFIHHCLSVVNTLLHSS